MLLLHVHESRSWKCLCLAQIAHLLSGKLNAFAYEDEL